MLPSLCGLSLAAARTGDDLGDDDGFESADEPSDDDDEGEKPQETVARAAVDTKRAYNEPAEDYSLNTLGMILVTIRGDIEELNASIVKLASGQDKTAMTDRAGFGACPGGTAMRIGEIARDVEESLQDLDDVIDALKTKALFGPGVYQND